MIFCDVGFLAMPVEGQAPGVWFFLNRYLPIQKKKCTSASSASCILKEKINIEINEGVGGVAPTPRNCLITELSFIR